MAQRFKAKRYHLGFSNVHCIKYNRISPNCNTTFQKDSSLSVKIPEYTASTCFLPHCCIFIANNFAFDFFQTIFACKSFPVRSKNLQHTGFFALHKELICCNQDIS